jgi:hypothetical protein
VDGGDPVNNRHPADQLADLRASIRMLREQEAELRRQLLDHPDDLAGDEVEATITEAITERVDVVALRRDLPEVVRPYVRARVVTWVTTKRRR